MKGTSDDKFSPKDPYTREQSIVTILRTYNTIKKQTQNCKVYKVCNNLLNVYIALRHSALAL